MRYTNRHFTYLLTYLGVVLWSGRSRVRHLCLCQIWSIYLFIPKL